MTTNYAVEPDLDITVDREDQTVEIDCQGANIVLKFASLFRIAAIVSDEMAEKVEGETLG